MKKVCIIKKNQAFHLDTPLQNCLSSLAAYFVGEVCTTFGKGLAALQCFEKLLTDCSKTAMCRSHHFPDSPDHEKDAVFCSCYASFFSPLYFHHHYSIRISFFLLKTVWVFFYFKYSFTTASAKEVIKSAYALYYPKHFCFIQHLDRAITSFKAASENCTLILKETSNYLNVLSNSGPFDNSMSLNYLKA